MSPARRVALRQALALAERRRQFLQLLQARAAELGRWELPGAWGEASPLVLRSRPAPGTDEPTGARIVLEAAGAKPPADERCTFCDAKASKRDRVAGNPEQLVSSCKSPECLKQWRGLVTGAYWHPPTKRRKRRRRRPTTREP